MRMKKFELCGYIAPKIKTIEIEVEQGIAQTKPGSSEGTWDEEW